MTTLTYTTPAGSMIYTLDPRFVEMIFANINRVQVDYSRWGWTRGGGKVWHGGIDIDTLPGMDWTVHSTVSGTVRYARCVANGAAGWGDTWQWGYFVWIVTADGCSHIYAHMAAGSLKVTEGQRVTAGQAVGTMGKTGNADQDAQAEHVHYEVRNPSGQSIDPTPWCGIPNKVGQTTNPKNKKEDDKMQMSTTPVAMHLGPMSSGDLTNVKATLDKLKIGFIAKDGYIDTALISVGDQDTVLKKVSSLKLGWGPLLANNDMALLEAKLSATEAALGAEKVKNSKAFAYVQQVVVAGELAEKELAGLGK